MLKFRHFLSADNIRCIVTKDKEAIIQITGMGSWEVVYKK